MKSEVDSEAKLDEWLLQPVPAVFQGQRLLKRSAEIASKPLDGCVFVGCEISDGLAAAAAKARCFVIPRRDDAVFDPFRSTLYEPDDLYDKYELGGYEACLDRRIYLTYADPVTRKELPADIDTILLRRLHDTSITDALDELLDETARLKCVAIMGGHDMGRDQPTYAAVAKLALDLAKEGFVIATGGGPGLMEAGNLGAFCNGFEKPEDVLAAALMKLKDAPRYDHAQWLDVGFRTWKGMGRPKDAAKSRNVGIPTWYYGHEPPNVFATHLAKYFENSVREDGLLAFAVGGIIFAEGNGGTVQEIFQDANQNYYRTIGGKKSPMVLFGVDYWNPGAVSRHNPKDRRKPAYALLEKLASEKQFSDYLLLTDDTPTIVKFIKEHPPV